MDSSVAPRQNIILENRNTLIVSGVKEVLGFDGEAVRVETVLGELWIRGSELRVDALVPDKSELSVTGNVDSLSYASMGNHRTWRERLFG